MSKHGPLGTMDPNSAHQLWAKWTFRVLPSGVKTPPFAQVKHAAAVFGRSMFGSASAMRVTETFDRQAGFVIEVRSEGRPAHDPSLVTFMRDQWSSWAQKGFGSGTTVDMDVKVEAGDRQDGRPREQLIMIESLAIQAE
jgi:hypothetical protein